MHLGEIRKNTFGTEMKIIECNTQKNIIVEFLDDYHYRKTTTYTTFKSGNVKNPYDKKICNVGYMGKGKYHCKYSNGIHTLEYQNWIAMIRRCYDNNRKNIYSAYFGNCKVCNQWHDFQEFGKWYEENFYQVGMERMHIDKDILYPGNKIYSPETCLIVPQGINMLFLNKPNKRGLPNGITQNQNGTYRAKYKEEELGTYNSLDEAYQAYTYKKKNHILSAAEAYRNSIPQKVYNAVIHYEFRIELDRNYVA